MALVTGQPAGIEGFTVVEARAGHFEVARDLGGSVVRFSASSEGKVLERAAAWVADQGARKDGGQLAAAPAPVKVGGTVRQRGARTRTKARRRRTDDGPIAA